MHSWFIVLIMITVSLCAFRTLDSVAGEPHARALRLFDKHWEFLAQRHGTATPKKLETGLRTISAGIPYTLLYGIEAMGFPTFGLLL